MRNVFDHEILDSHIQSLTRSSPDNNKVYTQAIQNFKMEQPVTATYYSASDILKSRL